MNKLIKNKKAMDYSAFLVIVVLIVIGYLFFQLHAKLDVFEMSIGEQEAALMDVYKKEDKLLFYVDKSAEYSVYHAFDYLARNGGAKKNQLPVFSENGFVYWYKDNNKLYRDIDLYDSFRHYLNMYLNTYFSKYPKFIPKDNYEFVVRDNKVIGVAVKPVLLNIFPNMISNKNYFSVASMVSKDLDLNMLTGLGVYAVRPSFSVDAEIDLDDFALLFDKMDVLLDCLKSNTVGTCVNSIRSDEFIWRFIEYPDKGVVAFNVVFNNLVNPHTGEKSFVRFVLELP
ncbi:hypothetical protein GF358_00830 [Candidatus Woesearchaeota archaeon]|nr:hypothetical protein [Candidatus Woesearchaeota archaeon]